MSKETNDKVYTKGWFLWVMIIFITPVGLFLLWKYHPNMDKKSKIIITIIFTIWFISALLSGSNQTNSSSNLNNGSNSNEKTVQKEEKVAFLKGTSAKDFYGILCSASGLTPGESKTTSCPSVVQYVSFDNNYQIVVYANAETDEIMEFDIATLQGDNPTNVFMAANRLDYNGKDSAKLTDFITNSIGKKEEVTIGDLIFKTWVVEYGNPANRPCFSGETLGYEEYLEACFK